MNRQLQQLFTGTGQAEWLGRLAEARRGKTPYKMFDTVRSWPGKDYLEAAFTEKTYNHRLVFSNEFVAEFDYPDYQTNAEATRIMTQFFNRAQIPHTLGYTGGKSIHAHVFMEMGEVTPSDKTTERLNKIGFQSWWARNWIVGKYLFPVLDQIDAKFWLKQKTSGLDKSMLNKSKLVREFGAVHEKTGFRKTWLQTIPDEPPQTHEPEYPPTPQLWQCEDLFQKSLTYVQPPKPSGNQPWYSKG